MTPRQIVYAVRDFPGWLLRLFAPESARIVSWHTAEHYRSRDEAQRNLAAMLDRAHTDDGPRDGGRWVMDGPGGEA